MIKGVRITGGKRKEAVEGIIRDIGAKVKVEEIKRIKGNEDEGTEMLWVRLENEGQRKEVMEKKNRLRDRKKRIAEDLTWRERERKMR